MDRRSFLKILGAFSGAATAAPQELPKALAGLATEATAAASTTQVAAAVLSPATQAASLVPSAAQLLSEWASMKPALRSSYYGDDITKDCDIENVLLNKAEALDKGYVLAAEYEQTLEREKAEGRDTIQAYDNLLKINQQIKDLEAAKKFLQSDCTGMNIQPAIQGYDIAIAALQEVRKEVLAQTAISKDDEFTTTTPRHRTDPPHKGTELPWDKSINLTKSITDYTSFFEKQWGREAPKPAQIAHGIAALERACKRLEREHGLNLSARFPGEAHHRGTNESINHEIASAKSSFRKRFGKLADRLLKDSSDENKTGEASFAKRYTSGEIPSPYGLQEILKRQAGEPSDDDRWTDEVKKNTPKIDADKGID